MQRELRELVRYRRTIIQERTREAARIQKVLEGANIKLASVASEASDVLGVSGRQILRHPIAGDDDDPQALAALVRGRLHDMHPALVQVLRGQVGPHQRLRLAEQLQHIEELETREARLTAEIDQRLVPFVASLEALDTVRRTLVKRLQQLDFDVSISDQRVA